MSLAPLHRSFRSAAMGALAAAVLLAAPAARAGEPAPAPVAPAQGEVKQVQAQVAAPAPAPAPVAAVAAKAEPAKDKDEDKPLHFQGLALELDLADASGLNAVGENYQNDWSMVLGPTWNVGKRFFKDNEHLKGLSVSGRFVLSGELSGTNEAYRSSDFPANANYQGCTSAAPSSQGGSVDTSNLPYCQDGAYRRADYSDINLTVSDKLYTVPRALIDLKANLTGVVPVSLESRNHNLITYLAPNVSVARDFLDKKLHLSYGFTFTQFFYSQNVASIDRSANQAVVDQNNPQTYQSSANTTADDARFAYSAGGLNASFALSHALAAGYDLNDKVSFSGMYAIVDTFKQRIDESCPTVINGMAVDPCANSAKVAARSGATLTPRGDVGSQIFRLAASYQINDILGAELSLLTAAPQRHPDSSWQQPFLDTSYNAYSSVNLGLAVTVDALAAKLLHQG